MKTLSAHPERAANAGTRTVTYVRDREGNLAKVRTPSRAVRTPSPGAEPPAGPPWRLPIPRVVRAVATSVAARYGVTVDAILSGERFPNTVRARHEWWRLVKDTWDLSYPETARLVGGVDHTSIMRALRARETAPRRDDKATKHPKKDVSEGLRRDALK
jgi:hypothetical protein